MAALDRGRRPPRRPRGGSAIRAGSSTRSSRSTCPSSRPLINGPDTPDLAHRVGDVGCLGAPRTRCPPRSRRRWWARAPTPPTRTSPGPPPSPARPAPGASGPVRRSSSRRAQIRSGPPSSATGSSATSRPSAPPCSPTPVGPASDSGNGQRRTPDGRTPSSPATTATSPKRNDGNAATSAFLASPEMVVAFALAGTLDFDPLTDVITTTDGDVLRLDPPVGRRPAPGRIRTRRATTLYCGAQASTRWWWSRPPPRGCNCSSPSPSGTAATTWPCRCS